MQKIMAFLSLFFCCCLANAGNASCCDCDPYEDDDCGYDVLGFNAGGLAGASLLEIKHFDRSLGYYVGAFVGYDLPYKIRIEGEVTFQRAEINSAKEHGEWFRDVSGHIQSWSFMANALYAFSWDFPFEPMLGLGLGYAQTRGNWSGRQRESYGSYNSYNSDYSYSDKEHHTSNSTGFAWQIIVGALFTFCDDYDATFEYRFEKVKDGDIQKMGFTLSRQF